MEAKIKVSKKEKMSEPIVKLLNNIKALRAIKDLSQQNVADRLGCDYSTYGKIENGKTSLTVDRLFELAEIFGVNVSHLLFAKNPGHDLNQNFAHEGSSTPTIKIELPLNDKEFIGQIKELLSHKN